MMTTSVTEHCTVTFMCSSVIQELSVWTKLAAEAEAEAGAAAAGRTFFFGRSGFCLPLTLPT
jgi:hypothetical protein